MLEADIFQTPLDEQTPAPLLQKKGKTSRFDRKYVEDTIKIRCSDFGKSILVPYKKPQPSCPLVGRKGNFTVGTLAHDLNVRYTVNLNSIYTTLDIDYDYGNNSSFHRSQSIRLISHELTFGQGWSFVCNICNKPTKTLFLPRGDSFFACRNCKGMNYGKCYFKKHIENHIPFYGMNRINKVISNCPNYKRYLYKKKPTKKFLRLYKMYLKEGVRFTDNMARLMKTYDIAWELREQVRKTGFCS